MKFSLLLGLILAAAPGFAQTTAPDVRPSPPTAPSTITRDDCGDATVVAHRLTTPLAFDGRLDESVYRSTQPFGDFIQQEPVEGGPSSDKTEVWVFFDDANLYVAARLWEK